MGTINKDLVNLLGGLKGCVERKLEKMGKIIYSYGKERIGGKVKKPRAQKDTSVQLKSRIQQTDL